MGQVTYKNVIARMFDSVGNAITSTLNALDVNIKSTDVTLDSTTDSVEVLQDTHDDLNANANMQVGNTDVSSSNPVPVEGPDADNTAITGNPVLIGGENGSGDIQTLQTAPDGDLIIHHHSADLALSDGISNTQRIMVNETDSGFLALANLPFYFNGTTWDRIRGDATDGMTVNLGTNNDVTVAGVATAANQLPDGHNVTVDNASGASAVNIQDGGNSITVDDGGTALNVKGEVAEGAAASGTDPIIAGFKNLSGNVAIPTTLTAGGIEVVAGLIADSGGDTLTLTGGAAHVTGAQAHSAVDSNNNPVKTGFKAFADDTPQSDVTANDIVNAAADLAGRLWTKDRPVTTTVNLSALEDTYDNTTTSNDSADIDGSGFRSATLTIHGEVGAGTPTHIQLWIEVKTDSDYYRLRRGPWTRQIITDGVFNNEEELAFNITEDEFPRSATFRIALEATGTGASDTFIINDCDIHLRN